MTERMEGMSIGSVWPDTGEKYDATRQELDMHTRHANDEMTTTESRTA